MLGELLQRNREAGWLPWSRRKEMYQSFAKVAGIRRVWSILEHQKSNSG